MSKVAIKGNASGTGTFTVEAPNSNTDRTLTLPDEAGTVLTSGTDVANFPSGFANGITEADQWRISAGLTRNSGQVVGANWERNDNNFQLIGTGMTESSGEFTFPSTGIYLIIGQAPILASTASNFLGFSIELSTDSGSTYAAVADGYADGRGTNAYSQVNISTILDVTNASTFRVRMKAVLSSSALFDGNSTMQRTGFTFLKLGET